MLPDPSDNALHICDLLISWSQCAFQTHTPTSMLRSNVPFFIQAGETLHFWAVRKIQILAIILLELCLLTCLSRTPFSNHKTSLDTSSKRDGETPTTSCKVSKEGNLIASCIETLLIQKGLPDLPEGEIKLWPPPLSAFVKHSASAAGMSNHTCILLLTRALWDELYLRLPLGGWDFKWNC